MIQAMKFELHNPEDLLALLELARHALAHGPALTGNTAALAREIIETLECPGSQAKGCWCCDCAS